MFEHLDRHDVCEAVGSVSFRRDCVREMGVQGGVEGDSGLGRGLHEGSIRS